MGRHEKIAWYNLAITGASILLFLVLFFVFKDKQSMELNIQHSSAAFAVLAFLAFGQTLFRKEGAKKGLLALYDPDLDERDIQIYRRANMHAFSIFWGLFVFIIMGFWMYFRWRHGTEEALMISFNVDMLPLLIWPCFIIIISVQAISTIIQQRSSSVDNGSQGIFVPNKKSLIVSLLFLPIFLVVSALIALHGGFLFAFQFATLTFGSAAMVIYEIRRKQVYSEDNLLIHGIVILGKVFNTVFTIMFGGLIVKFILDYVKSGSFHVPSLFILLFIALVFYRSVIADLRRHIRECRHEKA